jgi:hypothetical protein
MVMDYRLAAWGIVVQFPARTRDFSVFEVSRQALGWPTHVLFNGYWGLFPWCKAAWVWTWTSSAEVKNEWHCASTTPHAMVVCTVKTSFTLLRIQYLIMYACMYVHICSFNFLVIMLIIIHCRFANEMVYVGLSYYGPALGSNQYVSFLLSALVEIPSYLLCWVVMDRWGRRWPLCVCMILSGVSCTITVLLSEG